MSRRKYTIGRCEDCGYTKRKCDHRLGALLMRRSSDDGSSWTLGRDDTA